MKEQPSKETVAAECHLVVEIGGVRLDKYVSENCAGISRTHAQQIILDGFVTVNGREAKASLKLLAGDKVDVTVPPPEPSHIAAENIPLDIVYEDDDLLVINKPAGMTVHPAPGNPAHTLVNAILSHVPNLPGEPTRPGIVHRLDKDTSGLMIVAKNRQALANLSDQFKQRSVVKSYYVLVQGHLTPTAGFIEAPIGRDPSDRKRMAVVSRGRDSRTEYKVLEYLDSYTLVEVRPETGRTHQIRVHLAAIYFPVAGDSTYGVKSPYLTRQFVHAYGLRFRLPTSGKEVEFSVALPPDLQQALDKMRRS